MDSLAVVLAKIDSIAENAIRDELDLRPLKEGELCPLRAIVDIVHRAQQRVAADRGE